VLQHRSTNGRAAPERKHGRNIHQHKLVALGTTGVRISELKTANYLKPEKDKRFSGTTPIASMGYLNPKIT